MSKKLFMKKRQVVLSIEDDLAVWMERIAWEQHVRPAVLYREVLNAFRVQVVKGTTTIRRGKSNEKADRKTR